MTEQDLDGAQVASRPVDDRRLGSAKRVRAIFAAHQTNPGYPFVDKPGILPGAEMTTVINPAWKDVIVHSAAPSLKPRQQAGPGIGEKFELNRPTRFLLHDDGPRSDLPSADDIANFHADNVATAQLAVDSEVEKGTVPQAAALIEGEADLPNLLGLQGPLRTDSAPRIPDRAPGGSIRCFSHFHDHSPMARSGHFGERLQPPRRKCVRRGAGNTREIVGAAHGFVSIDKLCQSLLFFRPWRLRWPR